MINVYVIVDDFDVVSGFSIDVPTGRNYASNQLPMDNEAPMLPIDVVVENGVARLRTAAEVSAEATRLQADYDSKQYQRDRAAAYPSLQNQADMQYHDALNNTTTWIDAINAVKVKYPKPNL